MSVDMHTDFKSREYQIRISINHKMEIINLGVLKLHLKHKLSKLFFKIMIGY